MCNGKEFLSYLEKHINNIPDEVYEEIEIMEQYDAMWEKIYTWEGYDVYGSSIKQPAVIGIPGFILLNQKEVRLSTIEESELLLSKL